MRLVFAGTPAFAAAALQALIESGHEIALVLTRPDRPAGRGLKVAASEVKQLALRHKLPLLQPETLREGAAQERLRAVAAKAMVVAAYGLILPRPVLDTFALGCINIHASLLPRWRGAAPIQRAILAGDRESGISIMRMEEGLDTGPVYQMQRIPIAADDSAGSLHDKLAVLGARCIVEVLPGIAAATIRAMPQAETEATYANKIAKEEAAIDWYREAGEIDRQVRAFNPFPGAFTTLRGEPVKIWRAAAVTDAHAAPGTILVSPGRELLVACGSGALKLAELQRAGGKRLSASDFLHGLSLSPSARFGA
jgi:methionyl-tRNA formyltransferase